MDLDKLMIAVRDGEPWAGPALVTVLGPTLMTHAARVGSDLSTADQELAVENAIERGINKIDRYDPTRAGPGAWLRQYVTYAVADLRRDRPTTTSGFDLDAVEEPPDPTNEPAAHPEAQRLAWLIRELRETDQLILRLRDYEQLDYATIAERIGNVTPEACRVRHHRAVKRLAELARNSGDFDALVTEEEP